MTGILAFQVSQEVEDYAYLAAAVLFIYGLKEMASPRRARVGNLVSGAGMLIAIVFTLLTLEIVDWTWIIAGLAIGSVIGAVLAYAVKMTAMPQMVAMLNGFGGLASGLVALVEIYRRWGAPGDATEFLVTDGVSTLIGWVTFTGSMVAFAKLQEVVVSGRPVVFRFQKLANFGLLVLAVLLIAALACWPGQPHWIIPLALVSAAVGVLFVIPIGGADMPVVISLLNSYSGLAAAATGFLLKNNGLIISGALVGASGIILTRLMCQAMNRSLFNVLFAAVGQVRAGEQKQRPPVKRYSAEDAAVVMEGSRQVVIVPGYGMAVAQAQHVIKELADLLAQRGVEVKYAIHPVAGRMPGHMNVLLAEANVPYDQLYTMEQINPEFEQADVALVIGANDVINPAARTDKGSPIYGMPILDVDKAATLMIIKRSLATGFAGVDNDLFYSDKTMMLFGDAKAMVTDIVTAMKAG
ncbi:MAG: NAD(P)(+) transhydrogenase (Re/Si-specific) subunit beta [Planctomycetaceae bacterium]|nr:NAD(P)(+) transhydrogenase (Re/Si-specific) subunit beta [Planctomycetaceae bacterium]